MLYYTTTLRGGAVVARQAHNLKAVGSIPAPATKKITPTSLVGFLFACKTRWIKGIYNFDHFLCVPEKSSFFVKKSSLILCSPKDFSKNVYLV